MTTVDSDSVHGADTGTLQSVNPVTGAVVGRAPVHDTSHVAETVAAARSAVVDWAQTSLRDRAVHLLRVRAAFADYAPQLAEAVSAETGKPLPDAYLEVMSALGFWTWAAKKGPGHLADKTVSSSPMVFKRATVRYEPLGVVGVITPWNFPIAIPMQSIPYALIAGNTVVFKPSEVALRTGQLIAEAINSAGRDLVHLVTGDGATGDALVRSGLDKVVFTGSGAVGRKILAAAADSLTPTVMELGGKDAAIVCVDADLSRAARCVAAAAFTNAGQLCMATERVYVEAAVYDEFVDLVVDQVRGLRVGAESSSHVGPLTRAAQAETLYRRLDAAKQAGARVLAGGVGWQQGEATFFPPTVVVDVTPDMELMREESFGPILSVVKVTDTDEAVALTNASEFGLNGSVFTTDAAKGRRLADRMQSGGVHINDALVGNGIPGVPFGGRGQSGFGRLQGDVGLFEFVAAKTIIDEHPGPWPALSAQMMADKRPSPALLRRVIAMAYSSGSPRQRLARVFGLR
jgi:acyl-CoA reductase-like NAD-dependent aldehyde dehydrogenase